MPENAPPGKPIMQYVGEGVVYVTPSKSSPGKSYITVYNIDKDEITCNCPGRMYQKKCWHGDTLRAMFVKEDDVDFQVNL